MNQDILINQDNPNHTLDTSLKEELTSLNINQDTYYRSRVFTLKTGINPVITNAQPLLTFLARLQDNLGELNQDLILENLNHEFKTFESRCIADQLAPEMIVLARYILQSQLHDILKNKLPGLPLKTAYPTLEKKQPSLDMVVTKLAIDPKTNLYLLELAYVTLALGEPSCDQDGRYTEQLYTQIRQIRGDKMPQLFLTAKIPLKKNRLSRCLYYLSGLSLGFFILTYLCFHFVLSINNQVSTMPNDITQWLSTLS